MMAKVPVVPAVLDWAIKRSGLDLDELSKFPLDDWRSGDRLPTVKQLESFAKKTSTPFGYLFLKAPPKEDLAVPSFRTARNRVIRRPSPHLTDVMYDMQRRQDWMREDRLLDEFRPLKFVGSVDVADVNVVDCARKMRKTLGLNQTWPADSENWEAAFLKLRRSAEQAGIMVAAASTVGLNNFRPLDPGEFRGFVLADKIAPAIFINAADAKSAQFFTFAHELAHLWLGESAVFDLAHTLPGSTDIELKCNRIAAEFLISEEEFERNWPAIQATSDPVRSIAKVFKVSLIVAARRALDFKAIKSADFVGWYNSEQQRWRESKDKSKDSEKKGGNFYATQGVRLGLSFSLAVARAVMEGRLLYTDAYRLTGLRGATFRKYIGRVMARGRK